MAKLTLHSCICGYIYQDSPVAATGYTFTTRVVDSTCTANGYVLKECSCGYSYQEGSNGHTFTTLVVEPTETVNGFTRHTCECGYSYESDPVVSLCTDEGAELPATADTKVYDYVYNGSSLTYLTITTTNYGESPIVETLYFGNGTVTYNGTVYYYVTNLQGDIVAILDTTGTAVVEYTYDAWGNILTTAGNMASTLGVANPLTYRGYVYDQESELYYLQSRFYNPEIGRFINADAFASTGQGLLGNNMFAYCNNNPIRYSDPYGTVPGAVIFPVCIDSGRKAVIAESDHVGNSDDLRDYVLLNYLPYTSSNVYINVTHQGTYTHVVDTSVNQAFSALGIVLWAIPLLFPGVREYAVLTKALEIGGTASTLYGLTAFQPPAELQNRDYSQYRATITWTETTNVVGYPNVFVTTNYSIEMWFLWDDDDRSNSYWYLQSSNMQEVRNVTRIY